MRQGYSWFESYLSGRFQYIRRGSRQSDSAPLLCGVPQGSVLGPILFLLYTADLLNLIQSHALLPHMYADDTQVYGICRPAVADELLVQMSACLGDVSQWMQSNRLQLNAAKTEVMWCSSHRRQHLTPVTPLMVCSNAIEPSSSVRNLGIFIDSDMSMNTHVTRTVSACFAALRQIRSIRRSVSQPILRTLVASMVLCRLDYGSSTLAGLPAHQLNRLQSVLNAAARLILSGRKYDHVTPLLRQLHWLKMPERVTYRLAVLAFRCLHGLAPSYLADELHRASDIEGRRRLRSSSSSALVIPATKRSTLGDRAFPVAAARAWNSLPPDVTAVDSLAVFKRRLKTALFSRSFSSSDYP